MATKQKKWGSEDDAKLAKLFRDKVIDPEKLSAKDIHLVHDRHFPERKNFSSFSALYRKKARAWSLHETLAGGRKNASTDDEDCKFHLWHHWLCCCLAVKLLAHSFFCFLLSS